MMMRPRKPQIYHFFLKGARNLSDGGPRPALDLPDVPVPGTSAHLVSVFSEPISASNAKKNIMSAMPTLGRATLRRRLHHVCLL